MSYQGYTVIDADSHFREYLDVDRTYREHIDPEYRESFEKLSAAVARRREAGQSTDLFMGPMAIIEPSNEWHPLGVYDTFGAEEPQTRLLRQSPIAREVNWQPELRLKDMDRAGIDCSVIFPSHAASYCVLRDVGLETALHRAHHRYMSQYCKEAKGRLRWVAIATMRDVRVTVEEISRWSEKDTHLAGVLVPPLCPSGRLLDNPDLHPLYRRAQELDLPILVHGGVLRAPAGPGAAELDHAGFIIRAVYQPWGGMTAMSALIGGGVFELFPKLRAGIFETSAGWVPWLVERLDECYESKPNLAPHLKRRPSEVLAEGRLFHSIDPGERYLAHCVQELGEDIWLFATDYPHTGVAFPNGAQVAVERPGLTESAKKKILGANAQRLFPRL
ncbi:MAG TPA: amidohydrolase family protein [Acidobacteriota bacterium]|nr:amidohydrolase family protein [Acidobacteriota bacterium]